MQSVFQPARYFDRCSTNRENADNSYCLTLFDLKTNFTRNTAELKGIRKSNFEAWFRILCTPSGVLQSVSEVQFKVMKWEFWEEIQNNTFEFSFSSSLESNYGNIFSRHKFAVIRRPYYPDRDSPCDSLLSHSFRRYLLSYLAQWLGFPSHLFVYSVCCFSLHMRLRSSSENQLYRYLSK